MLILSYARSKNMQAYMKRAAALETTPLKLFTFEQFQNFNMYAPYKFFLFILF